MVASPIRSTLYRRARWVVIWALVCFGVAQVAAGQVARKAKKDTGPRALALVELSSDGNARLIPVCILMDGKFWDASAYKASPVPFALWTGTVYEGEKTGVPQGLFTVAEAGHFGNDIWFGQGKWVPAGSETKAHRKNDAKPKMEVDEGPPKLRRPGADKPSDSSAPSASTPTSSAPQENKSPSAGTAGAPDKTSSSAGDEKKPDNAPAPTSSNDEDPNRPMLKRGKPETLSQERPQVGASTGVPRRPAGAAATAETKKASSQLIPAISDASGPDPRPYAYDLKATEEEKYRKGMLALASDAFAAKFRQSPPATPAPSTAHKAVRSPAKGPQPTFENVQFRAFDLWNTNEPVFVLSATARVGKAAASEVENSDQNYYVTVVAKNNIYDELRKLYVGITDARHLDQTPRMELIDAVDADGDGRGELLFRRISDAGKAWAVYRAGADQLFPLFEGTPPENKPGTSSRNPE